MKLTIFTANCRGRQNNTLYPNKCIIDSEEDFLKVVGFDHVCGEYKGNRRSVDNFLASDCIVMDNDNDHSDNPDDWIKPEDYAEMFPDVAFVVVPSRNNMKAKDGKAPRPKHHVYFPIDPVTDKDAYKQLKEMLVSQYPFFDGNALDAARFIYGNPTTEILWHEGEITIDCILSPPQTDKTIPQGQRNNTMSRFAGRILKRYGITERAYSIFIEESNKCNPPLESEELETIWRSACRFAKKVMEQDGYIPPEEYDFITRSLKPYVYLEELIISYGVGSNGKSTFWNSIAGVLGSYSGNISADTLTIGCKRNVKPELAEAKGKRLLIAAELEEGMRLNTSTVKQLCSTDEIFAEKKYKDPFSFKPSHTLVLYTNHLPKVGAMDDGIWRRLIVIPFNAKISGKSDIKNYSEFLIKNSGGYIVKWLIEGAKKAIDNHFRLKNPKVVQEAIDKYRQDNDWMTHFLDACCELGTGLEEKSSEVYLAYRSYCARTGEFIRSTAEFYNALELRGIRRRRTSKKLCINYQYN